MINFNGNIETQSQMDANNRAFKYGDAIFETIKVVNGTILYLEDHYFRLMASMRVIRMEIPMSFTMEFIEEEILKLVEANQLTNTAARVRLTVYRDTNGFYAPENNEVSYFMEAAALKEAQYQLSSSNVVVDLFKDHYIVPQLLSTLKTNNRVLNVVASVFAKENGLDNCFLLNSNKQVVEAINGNVFLVNGNLIKTPPLTDGCVKGIMRKQVIELVSKFEGYTIEEASISPFELQKADEIFITNVIQGVVSVTKYRKKGFENKVATEVVAKINKLCAGMQLMNK